MDRSFVIVLGGDSGGVEGQNSSAEGERETGVCAVVAFLVACPDLTVSHAPGLAMHGVSRYLL